METQQLTINEYKRKFDRELRHIKVIMMGQKRAMPEQDWYRFVLETKKSIMTDPGNYLKEVPEKTILIPALNRVFRGFLDDQKIRDAQRRL